MAVVPGRSRVHVWISGRVQGVGFRYSTMAQAERYGLSGWVRNLADGRVEAVFEGAAAEVARVVAWCREGPPGAWVSELRSEPEPPTGDAGFHARPTASGRETP